MAAVAITATAIAPGTAGKVLAASATGGQRRWSFLIDLKRCIGCKACAVACKTEFGVPLGVFRSSVKELDEGSFPNLERSFLPWLCNHCENPICIQDCPVDEIDATFVWPDGTSQSYKKRATYKRPDGVVLVDQDRCVGCAACVDLCPYEVRFLNPARQTVSEDAVDDYAADKCTLCAHRLDAGLVPACVNTCQADARIIGDLNDPTSEISGIVASSEIQVLIPEEGTDPQCRYVALNPRTFSEGRDTR
jgi:tetrathionate reductase subunit B